MNQNTSEKPAPTEDQEVSGESVASPLASLTDSWKEVLIGLVIAAVAFGAVYFYKRHASEAREQAFTQLAVASSLSQLTEITRQFPSSKAAALAAFMAAHAQYDAGNYAEAGQLYDEFIATHKSHFMAPAARLGRLHCQEAAGQTEEALAGFRQFAQEYPAEAALATEAKLGEARCLRLMGKLQDALAVYEKMILEQPGNDWQPLIEDLKNTVTRDLERQSAPASPAAAS
ncbi:MAG: tetratricopeptide repeat protein [Kiritimatiellia bacterium]